MHWALEVRPQLSSAARRPESNCCQNTHSTSSLMNHWMQTRACGAPCRKEKLQAGVGHIASSPGYPSLWWS